MRTSGVLLFLIISVTTWSQNTQIDSIQNLLKNEQADTTRIKLLFKLAKLHRNAVDYEAAVETQFKALQLAQKRKDTARIARSHQMLGAYYSGWNKFKIAIDHYFKALDAYLAVGDSLRAAFMQNDIGYAYLYFEDYERVIAFYNKALDYYYRHDIKFEIALTEANVGFAYNYWNKPNEAVRHFEIALANYKAKKAIPSYGKVYHGIAWAEYLKGNYQRALQYADSTGVFDKRFANEFGNYESRILIAKIHLALGNFTLAEKFLSESERGIANSKNTKWRMHLHETRYELLKKQGQHPKALKAFRRMKEVEDSLFNVRLQSEIVEMEIINETEKKEKAIIQLRAANEMAEREVVFQQKLLLGTAAAIAVLSALLVLIYRQYQSRQKAYRKLFEKNKQLIEREIQQKEQAEKQKEPQKKCDEQKVPTNQINESEKERIVCRLQHLMGEKQLFLNPNLKLNDLCKRLNTNSAYLSQIINQEYGKNFNTYVNEFRVKEAQKSFLRGEHQQLNLEGIATKVGFKTRVTFNSAFKKFTGVTPTFYIDSLAQEADETKVDA